jgi:peptidoglycan hydrolase CwlO-like protein
MDDTKKMLHAIINGQSAMQSELLGEIQKVDKKVDQLEEKVGGLSKKVDQAEKRLTVRIDKLGLQLARLEDDAPTINEFEDLEKRVEGIEKKTSLN